jgi:hypothetical protein
MFNYSLKNNIKIYNINIISIMNCEKLKKMFNDCSNLKKQI